MGIMACTMATACATPNAVTYSAVNPPPHPLVRRSAAEVDVVLVGAAPRPHVDVGLFEVEQGVRDDGYRRSTEDMIATLRLHAALRGCDAIQVLGPDRFAVGHHGRSARVLRGVCAIYTDAPAAPRSPLPPLPHEGERCGVTRGPAGEIPSASETCPDPLVCRQGGCASPYQ
jgi:hypothetical protein